MQVAVDLCTCGYELLKTRCSSAVVRRGRTVGTDDTRLVMLKRCCFLCKQTVTLRLGLLFKEDEESPVRSWHGWVTRSTKYRRRSSGRM